MENPTRSTISWRSRKVALSFPRWYTGTRDKALMVEVETREVQDFDELHDLGKVAPKRRGQAGFLLYGMAITLVMLLFLAGEYVLGVGPNFNFGENSSDTQQVSGPVVPIPCHSHNDYWRELPVFSALAAGCAGIEADVWWSASKLYVGHDRRSLREENTFTSLYVDPLAKLLSERNWGNTDAAPRGIFEMNTTQSLVLLVDLKTAAKDTWPMVLRQLEPLRERGWLSTVVDGKVQYGPVTVVATGTTDFDSVMLNSTHRDYFFDAPIDLLPGSTFDATNSYYTSQSFKKTVGYAWFGTLSDSQLGTVREHVAEAHKRGLKLRYWSLPSWPTSVRNHIWSLLVSEGVDIINVDDVQGARQQWKEHGWPTLA